MAQSCDYSHSPNNSQYGPSALSLPLSFECEEADSRFSATPQSDACEAHFSEDALHSQSTQKETQANGPGASGPENLLGIGIAALKATRTALAATSTFALATVVYPAIARLSRGTEIDVNKPRARVDTDAHSAPI